MAERKPISVALRFEIFKRDGFRCRYCGATAIQEPLEIDHVVPVSRGGHNDPENLVTACWSCNSGKRDRDLAESHLPTPMPAKSLLAQADQIQEYLDAQRAVVEAREEVRAYVAALWTRNTGHAPRGDFRFKVDGLLRIFTIAQLDEAFRLTARQCDGDSLSRWKYAQGILRRWQEQANAAG